MAAAACVYGTFTLSGDAKIEDNTVNEVTTNNVYLPSWNMITLGTLTEDAHIGITTDKEVTKENPVIFTNVTTLDNTDLFFSDKDNAIVVKKDGAFALEFFDGGITKLPTKPGNYYLKNDIEITDPWNVPSGDIIIDLKGHNITMSDSGRFINVGFNYGANLTVTDSLALANPSAIEGKITGGNSDYGGGVYVAGSGKFTLVCGNITGNTASNDGGGVYVNTDGTFTMYGGNITGNTASNDGGGVYVYNGGSFTQYGGNITGNTATNNCGGVYVENNGSFTIYGGNITDNTATERGGGMYVDGGNFTMSGGNITDNTAKHGGGVYVSSSTFNLSGGNITDNTATERGGGVYVNGGNFTMSGGNIAGNTASSSNSGSGGGVYVTDGSFIMSGGNITCNNAKNEGGGVDVNDEGSFIMSGGNITGNTADFSGGVLVQGGSFTQYGGNITDNTAKYYGGGVFFSSGSFTMSGGNIASNTAEIGGGVYVNSGSFIMSNDATVDANNDIHLSSSQVITVDGSKFTGSALNITVEDIAIDNTIVQVGDGSDIPVDNIVNQFKLYDENFVLKADSSKKSLVVAKAATTITGEMVTVNPTEYTYTGSEINISENVTVTDDDSNKLVEGKDYKLEGDYNSSIVGDHNVKIVGIGNYNGTIEKTWTIQNKSIDGFKFEVPEIAPIYDGNVVSATVTVIDEDGNTLVKDEDYVLEGDVESATAGTYHVNVTGINNYTGGKKSIEWTIAKRTPTADNITITSLMEVNYDGKEHPVDVTGAEGMGEITVFYNDNSTLIPVEPETYFITINITEGVNYTAAGPIELGELVIKPVSKEEPVLPDIVVDEDTGEIEVPKTSDNATIERIYGTNNITITDNTSNVVLEIEFEDIPVESGANFTGKPKNVVAQYLETPMIPSDNITGIDGTTQANPGDAKYRLNLTFGSNVTTNLPVINATVDPTVKEEFASKGKELMAMFNGSNTDDVNNNLQRLEVVLTFKESWYNKMNKGLFWYHRADNGTILHEERIIVGSTPMVVIGSGDDISYQFTIIIDTPPFFSGYGLYGMYGYDPKPSSGGHSGSSVWATETPVTTPTPTDNSTVKPTTNITVTETIPTGTQPTVPSKTPAPVLGVLAGLGLVGLVLRRK